jgi:uncharacterized protein (DUF488 family)
MTGDTPTEFFTIGHSTHPIDVFVGLLTGHGIETLVDVRSFPGSRRHPQFNREALAAAIRTAGLSYRHMASLGGRRKEQDVALGNAHSSHAFFASYADYATTGAFRTALAELERLGGRSRVAIMCAESLWWQCHRRIIAEELVRDGFAVTHIMPPKHADALARSPELPGL